MSVIPVAEGKIFDSNVLLIFDSGMVPPFPNCKFFYPNIELYHFTKCMSHSIASSRHNSAKANLIDIQAP